MGPVRRKRDGLAGVSPRGRTLPTKHLGARIYSLAFFLAFALSLLMLATDNNLRTDFGTVTSGYYLHWYVILVAALADLVGAILLVVLATRRAILGGVVGSGLLALIFLGDIFTYSQVGFTSATSFADYLFGITYYGGDIRYLYDLLLAVYLGTFIGGLILFWKTRELRPAPGSASVEPPADRKAE